MSRYASLAEAYWRTYLPSQTAQLDDPTAFFQDLGDQVAETVDRVTADLTRQSGSLAPMDRVREARAAQKQAEEMALEDLVYLPKEPGTERLELPTTGPLAGWDLPLPGEQAPEASAPVE